MTARPPTKPRRSGHLAIVPAAAVFDLRLIHADIRVLTALSAYADKQGRCWPSTSTIAISNRRKRPHDHPRTMATTDISPDTNDLRGGEQLADDRKTYAVNPARTNERQRTRVTRHHDC